VRRQRPDCKFSKLDTQPIFSPVYASLDTSQRPAQNSGPSGSLLLSREALSSSAPCRFIPAHTHKLFRLNSFWLATRVKGRTRLKSITSMRGGGSIPKSLVV